MTRIPVIVELRRLARRQSRHAVLVALLRGLWLALMVAVIGLAAHVLDRPVPWTIVVAIAAFLLLVSLVRAFRHRSSPARLARWLDRHFGLREQLATAHEIATRRTLNHDLQARLIDHAGETLRRLRRHPALTPRFPVRELETVLALILVAGGLWLLLDTGNSLPTVARRQLPPAIEDPVAQPVRNPSPRLPPEIREAVARLAEALRQNPLTRGAGEALAQGDTAGAAGALRDLADRVGQLTPEERDDLADALRGAADSLEGELPEVRDALDRAADRLERGSDAEAAQALEELAREVEALGAQQPPAVAGVPGNQEGVAGQPESEGNGSAGNPDAANGEGEGDGQQSGSGRGDSAGEGSGGQEQPSAPPEELGTEGVPLELDPGDEGPPTSQPANEGERPGGTPQRARGFTRGGAPDPGLVETGTDPQRYPWELRGTVRDYFQPAP